MLGGRGSVWSGNRLRYGSRPEPVLARAWAATAAVFTGSPCDPVVAGLGLVEFRSLSHALVAQLDRASASEVEGYRFDPCRGYSTAPGVSARRCTGPHSSANTAKTAFLGFASVGPASLFGPCRQMPVWISGSDFGVYLEPPWAWILGIWGEEDRGPADAAGPFPQGLKRHGIWRSLGLLREADPAPLKETSTHPDYRAADGSVRISVAARSKSRVCT